MAKTIDDLRRFLNDVERRVLGKPVMQKLADEAKDIVFKRTKNGFGVNNDDPNFSGRVSNRRLDALSESYKNLRRKTGVPGSFGSPRKANLTYTGQLLDSMTARGTNNGEAFVEIPNSNRRPLPGRRSSYGVKNAELARFVSEQGRPFFALAEDEKRILEKTLEKELEASFKRFL